MENKVICPACGYENNFFNSICSSCKTYIRERIVNIDLWSIISLLIENPFKAFRNIIYSEHKNFISFLIPLIAIKYLILIRVLSLQTIGEFYPTASIVISYLIVLALIVFYINIFSYVLKTSWKSFGLVTRFKDNLAIITYAQLPFVFTLLVLFPLEVVIFGDYLFSINPSPFQIKDTVAYIFSAIEILAILWSIFLLFAAFYISTKNRTAAMVTTFIFVLFLSIVIILTSKVIFTI